MTGADGGSPGGDENDDAAPDDAIPGDATPGVAGPGAETTDADAPTRAGFVALIGAPNAGKSTLVNHFVGAKVSIVTHKVQTTRTLVRGVVTEGRSQVVFVDTPGIFEPKRSLDRAMVRSAWSGARDADIVVLLVDAQRGFAGDAARILGELESVRAPRVLALNKVDRIDPERLLLLAAEANARVPFERTFMISALKGSGTDDLLDHLLRNVPEGPWFFPGDQVSDFPLKQLAAEVTREKLYLRLHQELPYAIHVETDAWEEMRKGGKGSEKDKLKGVRIDQTVYVGRASQKGIVLGKGGATLKAIGQAAREELAEMLERPVHLFLHVKVRNWESDPERYREMGLEFRG